MRGSHSADADLIAGWVAARSVARGLPAPVAAYGGWRVDTRSAAERCRYVFAKPDPAITELAPTIDRPRVFLKLCADASVLARLLPGGWHIGEQSWVMTSAVDAGERSLPAGYEAIVSTIEGAIEVRITATDGTLAASGYAAEAAGVFAYDRIVTEPAYRRRSLGAMVMTLLGSQRQSGASKQVLVATAQGRALYETLGWQVHAPYASAVIPDPIA